MSDEKNFTSSLNPSAASARVESLRTTISQALPMRALEAVMRGRLRKRLWALDHQGSHPCPRHMLPRSRFPEVAS